MMVADQFPIFKLLTLLARQLSSPIAVRIKKYAMDRPRIGGVVCRRLAQTYHEYEWLTRLWTLRLSGVVLPRNARPPPLRDEVAINLGGDLLGEIIIFTLGSLIIIFEVNRQVANKENQKLEKKSRWLAILLSLEEIQHEINLQQAEMDRLHATLLHLQSNKPTTE